MKSIYKNLGGIIEMPEFKGRNLYMHKMRMDEISLPTEVEDFKNPIETILSKIENRSNVCYVTIDEKHINGCTHRRSGIHVDFNWDEKLKSHSGGGNGGHKNIVSGKWGTGGYWNDKNIEMGGMLLVSNYEGCKVWKGEYDGEIKDGGDCSGINVSNLESEIMPANEVYYLNALGIHESLVINKEVYRTLIRINFHPDYIFN